MKSILRSVTIALLLIAFVPCCRLEAKAPNILFCMADDWGWPHAGAYGDQVIKTPTFDRLAKEGILFERAFVSSPSCTPCRNSILTGQQFYRLESGANLWSTLDVSYPNFMFLLREAGYEIGHWRKAWGPGSFKPGGYTEDPCGPASTFNEFMQQRDRGKPFCFWFGTSDPHRSYVKDSGAKSGIPVDKVHVPAFYPDTAEIRSDIADYYFEVQRWDSDVGKAIKLLEAANELDNTIIVMTGDHGMPFPRCKANLYDWGTRVPLAIRWGQQVKLPRSVDTLVSLTDLAPTFLEVAGAEIPEEMTGHSLLPILKNQSAGRSDSRGDFVVFGRERHVPAQQKPSMQGYPARAIRTDRWMLKLNIDPERWPAGAPSGATHMLRDFAECDDGPTKSALMGMKDDPKNSKYYQLSFAKRPAVELYDCRQDPDQINNLADQPEHAATVAKLRGQLIEYLRNTQDPRFTDKPVKFETYRYYGRLETLKPVTGRIWMRSYDFKAADKEIEYGLYVPEGYDAKKSYPLMVVLHGFNSNPRQILNYPGFTKLAQQHGYILAAPLGYNTRGWYGGRGQTSRRWAPENLGELSEKDVMNVLEIVRDEFNVDSKRIYLTGHSMGGGGTWHLGIKYPDIWAGLAPIAPAMFRSPNDLAKIKTTPVILVQGEKDRLVPVRGARRWASKMKELGMTHKYIEVKDGNHIKPAITQLPAIFEFFARPTVEPELEHRKNGSNED